MIIELDWTAAQLSVSPTVVELPDKADVMPLALYWLALGAFCIGTATFITAPLLPAIAAELGVSVATAGHLVTLYALTYAVGSPVVSTVLGGVGRKALLVGALGAFAAVNLLAATVQSFWQLMAIQ